MTKSSTEVALRQITRPASARFAEFREESPVRPDCHGARVAPWQRSHSRGRCVGETTLPILSASPGAVSIPARGCTPTGCGYRDVRPPDGNPRDPSRRFASWTIWASRSRSAKGSRTEGSVARNHLRRLGEVDVGQDLSWQSHGNRQDGSWPTALEGIREFRTLEIPVGNGLRAVPRTRLARRNATEGVPYRLGFHLVPKLRLGNARPGSSASERHYHRGGDPSPVEWAEQYGTAGAGRGL
jgi:hypothetical protein